MVIECSSYYYMFNTSIMAPTFSQTKNLSFNGQTSVHALFHNVTQSMIVKVLRLDCNNLLGWKLLVADTNWNNELDTWMWYFAWWSRELFNSTSHFKHRAHLIPTVVETEQKFIAIISRNWPKRRRLSSRMTFTRHLWLAKNARNLEFISPPGYTWPKLRKEFRMKSIKVQLCQEKARKQQTKGAKNELPLTKR